MGRKTEYVQPDRDCASVEYLERWRDLLLNGKRSRQVKDDRAGRYMRGLAKCSGRLMAITNATGVAQGVEAYPKFEARENRFSRATCISEKSGNSAPHSTATPAEQSNCTTLIDEDWY
jgi:hypothetical protein